MIAQTIADELRRTAAELSSEEPYAFTLIQGQLCNYLGYAVATEAALTAITAKYIAKGYRYLGRRKLADADAIRAWLRWANPDDGWHYRDFCDAGTIERFLAMHNHDDESLRNACIDQLKAAARPTRMDARCHLRRRSGGLSRLRDPNLRHSRAQAFP